MCTKGTIIYIGNFEMPNKNAAAHRVLGNAKIFRRLGYKVVFVGADREGHNTETIKSIDGFDICNRPYPRNFKQWITHLFSNSNVKKIIDQYSDTRLIVCYNTPAFASLRIKRYAQIKGIKVVGDYTEWYGGTKISSFRGLMAKIDTELRMRVIAKKLDGLIVISNFMKNYYLKKKCVVQIPPLVDLSEDKWSEARRMNQVNEDNIRVTFAGNSGQKDRIDILLESLANISNKKFTLYVVGQTKEQCIMMYGKKVETFINQLDGHVIFLGWCTHQEVLQNLMNSDLCMFIRQSTLQNKAGFPTKYVEATTCGVPTITTDVGDIGLYIKSGVNGILINEGEEFKDVSEILMLGKEKYNQMKQNLDISMFSYENYISITESWLNSMEL
jgi:glycosyltransferase involved in cell wall biosynthesis